MKQIFTFILIFALSFQNAFSQEAPDFSFTDINGETHTLSETLAEGKVVLLDFFFVNCPPCIEYAPDIDDIVADFENTTLEIWGISDRDNNETIGNSIFNPTHSNHFVGGAEGEGLAAVNLYAANFNFTGFPTYAVVCSDGSITWDVWPITPGASEIRTHLTEACGVVELVSNIADVTGLSNATIYPNPATDYATLSFDLSEANDITISVVNTLGQVVNTISNQSYNAGLQTVNIDVADLAKGIYAVSIQTKTGVHSMELTVAK